MVRRCIAVTMVLTSICALAQQFTPRTSLTASASVPLAAIKWGEVRLSVRTAPVSLDVGPGRQKSSFMLPLTTSWNVSPQHVNGIEVIGYFDQPDKALVSQSGDTVASCLVDGRINSEAFRPFNETNPVGPSGGSLRFFAQTVTDANRRGIRNDELELKVDDSIQRSKPASHYVGVLHLEARYF